jgi:hypothetical protein
MNKDIIVQALITAVVVGVLGLIFGYLIYGKVAGDYVSLSTLFSSSSNVLERTARSIAGIDAIRSKVFLCGGVGALIGLVGGFGFMLNRNA